MLFMGKATPNHMVVHFFFINNLNVIFGLDKNELKWYVKSWVKKQSQSFQFNTWWTPVCKRYEYMSPNEWSVIRLQNGTIIEPNPINVLPINFRYIGGIDPAYVYSPYIPDVQTPQVFDMCDEFRNAFLNYYAE